MSGAVNSMQGFSLAIQSVLAGVLLVYFSLLDFEVLGVHLSLMFLPLLALYFWQYQASYGLSLTLIAALGLWQDLISAGPLGLWMLIYALLFAIINPTTYKAKPDFRLHYFYFVILISAAVTLAMVFGRLAIGQWPSGLNIGLNALATILVFPFAYWLRMLFIQAAIENDRSWQS